jgi:hypothetical protein
MRSRVGSRKRKQREEKGGDRDCSHHPSTLLPLMRSRFRFSIVWGDALHAVTSWSLRLGLHDNECATDCQEPVWQEREWMEHVTDAQYVAGVAGKED